MVEYNSDSIQTLSSLEHIRKLSQMYVPDPSLFESQTHILKEITDNSFDEVRTNKDRKTNIDILFFRNKKKYQILVADTGRGVPITKIKDVYSKTNTSGKWSGSYICSSGCFGVGASATAALSNIFVGLSNRQEGIGFVTLRRGAVLHDVVQKKKQKESKDNPFGTIVFYEPDETIFEGIDKYISEGFGQIIDLLEFSCTFISDTNVTLTVIDKVLPYNFFDNDPKEIMVGIRKMIEANDGTPIKIRKFDRLEYSANRNNIPFSKGYSLKKLEKKMLTREDKLGYEIEFFIPEKNLKYISTGLVGAVNMTPINKENSFHISGLVDTVKKFIKEYEDNEDVQSYIETIYRIPICGYILAYYQDAVFVGQTKNEFKDKHFLKVYVSELEKQLKADYTELFWENMYEYLKEDIHKKYQKYHNRTLSLGKDLKNIAFKLKSISRYDECRSNDSSITELFITEGTSAGGTVSEVCDKEFQAVFKSRGKPSNATKKVNFEKDKLNQDLITIIGVSPLDKNLDNMNFSRIIILCDADLVI